jgi:hypothetical protein
VVGKDFALERPLGCLIFQDADHAFGRHAVAEGIAP